MRARTSKDEQGCLLNYIWINNNIKTPQEDVLCNVPLNYIDKAHENAVKYPDAKINIWIDYNFLDDKSKFFVESHHYAKNTSNVALKSLGDIPSYRDMEVFNPDSSSDIWSRVDLARLLVVKHCFDTTQSRDVFYSDFDVNDTSLNTPEVIKFLSNYGMVFSGDDEMLIENGYMGYRRGNGEVFLEELINKTIKEVSKGNNGYGALCDQYVYEWERKQLPNTVPPIINILNDMFYNIPDNPLYTDNNICSPSDNAD